MGYYALALIVIMIIATVLQYTLTPKPKVESARPKTLGDFQVPTATEDRSIPIMWGTIDIKGPNVLWYGDLKTTRKRKTKGGQKILLAYQYFIGIDLLLCYGPIDRVTRLEISDKVYPATEDVSGVPTARITPAFPITPTEAGLAVDFTAEKALGGLTKGGTVAGTMRMYSGGPNQQRSTYLQGQLGTNIPAYVNVAHVVGEQIQVGESTNIGAYIFRVSRFPDNLGLTGTNHIVRGTIDDGDANPMEVLFEVLTSDLWGLSLDPSRIDIQSLRDAGNTLADEQNGMSWIITSVLPAIDIVAEVIRQVDGVFYEDANGQFCVRLIRDDYVPAALPIFNETNISKLNDFSRASWSGSQNHVNIGYADRAKEFQATGAMSQDLANVRIQGAEVRGDYQYPGVKHADTAQQIAERELRVLSFPLAKIVFTTNRNGGLLIPGDVVRFSWDRLGIQEMIVRIMQVNLGDIVQGRVQVTGVQDVFRVAESIYQSPNPTGWTRPTDVAQALVAGEELVREMPRIFGNLYPAEITNPSLARTWDFIRRPAAQASTLNAEIFVDHGAGAGFLEGFGDIELIPLAVLDVEYPQATADIEVSDLLSIDNAIELTDIDNAVASQIAAGFNLVLIEGATQAEDEVVGFETLIDDGDGTFKLRNAHRGLLDTQARTHAIGARVWFFAEEPSYSSSTFGDTDAIDVKHVPSTTTDTLDVFEALSNALTFARRTQRPHHPANFTVNATRVAVATDETANLDFDWEHRLNSDLTVRDADDGDATGQDTEVEYDLEFFNAVTAASLRATTLTSPAPGWLTFLYTQVLLQTDTGEVGNFPLEVRLQARYAAGATNNPANLASLQEITRQFNVDMGGATVNSIDLDGTTEYLANTTHTTVGLANEFSINVWVRGNSNVGGTQRDILHLKPAATNLNRISLVLTDDSNGSAFNVLLHNSAGTLFKDYDFGSFTVNTWTMLTVTWDGTSLTVYQDGVAQTPTLNTDNAGTMTDNSRTMLVGATTTPAASWAGHIFALSEWTTELAVAEIVEIDAGTSAFNVRENSGDYVSRATMTHLYDFRDSGNIGKDYRNQIAGGSHDIDTNAANITAADLDAVEIP
jgi:hypothetical protein